MVALVQNKMQPTIMKQKITQENIKIENEELKVVEQC